MKLMPNCTRKTDYHRISFPKSLVIMKRDLIESHLSAFVDDEIAVHSSQVGIQTSSDNSFSRLFGHLMRKIFLINVVLLNFPVLPCYCTWEL
jgi:hypothetical protein